MYAASFWFTAFGWPIKVNAKFCTAAKWERLKLDDRNHWSVAGCGRFVMAVRLSCGAEPAQTNQLWSKHRLFVNGGWATIEFRSCAEALWKANPPEGEWSKFSMRGLVHAARIEDSTEDRPSRAVGHKALMPAD
jgi:hypothetical protein